MGSSIIFTFHRVAAVEEEYGNSVGPEDDYLLLLLAHHHPISDSECFAI